MGLKSQLTKAVTKMFKTFDDITIPCYITRQSGGVYDPVTDSYTNTETITYTFKGIIKKHDTTEVVDSSIEQIDFAIMTPQNSLTITPQPGEDIFINGNSYKIIKVHSDAAKTLYTIEVKL